MIKIQFFLLLIISLSLGSCKENSEELASPKHEVKVRVTGSNVANLGAEFRVFLKQEDEVEELIVTGVVPNNGSAEYTIGSWEPTAAVSLVVYYQRVTSNSTIQPALTSRMIGELLIDKQVKATVIVDNRTTTRYNDSPAGIASKIVLAN